MQVGPATCHIMDTGEERTRQPLLSPPTPEAKLGASDGPETPPRAKPKTEGLKRRDRQAPDNCKASVAPPLEVGDGNDEVLDSSLTDS